jgi:DHA3 family tetracycline resistance protein-like MFS transporter
MILDYRNKIGPEFIYYIYSGGFAFFFALMTTVFSIYHIDVVRLNPFQLVIIGTILESSCFIFEIPTGVVADYYSRRRSIIIGLIIMGIGIFIEGYFPLFITVALAQVIWGFGATFLSGADIAWITDEVKGKNIDKILLKGTQIRQIFILMGIFVSISLATFDISLPIKMSGLLFILLGIFLYFFMPELNFQPVSKNKTETSTKINTWSKLIQTFTAGIKHIKGNKVLIFLFSAVILGGLYSEGFDRLWTIRFLRELSFPTFRYMNPLYWFAIIPSGGILINLTFIEWIKRNMKESTSIRIIWLLSAINMIMASSIFIFAFAGNFYLAAASYWLIYAMRYSHGSLNDIIINKNISDSGIRATVFSMKAQLDQVGQIVGGPIIGLIASKWSVPIGLLSSGLIILPIVFIYVCLTKYKINQGGAF